MEKTYASQITYPFVTISGEGLGYSYSSLTQVGEVLPSHDIGQAKIRLYVNTLNGNFIIRDHVVTVMEMNFPLELYYIYNSQASGPNWRFAHREFKKLPDPHNHSDIAILVEADGHETTYTYASSGNYWFAPFWGDGRPFVQFDYDTNLWVWFSTLTQIKEYYDTQGRLLKREDAIGRVTKYEYQDQKNPRRLTAIVAPSYTRYTITRRVNPDGSYEEWISKDADNKSVTLQQYLFDSRGVLQKSYVSMPPDKDYEISYEYYVYPGRLCGIKQADQTVLDIDYDDNELNEPPFRVTMVSQGTQQENVVPIFGYIDYPNQYHPDSTQIAFGSSSMVTGRLHFNKKNQLAQVDQYQGYPDGELTEIFDETKLSYSATNQIEQIIHPGGGIETFEYKDTNGENYFGMLTRHTKPNNRVMQRVFDPGYSRRNLICEADYLPDGKATVTRYVYDQHFKIDGKDNGLFLRFKISPEGRVTEYRPDSYGNIETQRTYSDVFFNVNDYTIDTAPQIYYMETQWLPQQVAEKVHLTRYIYDSDGQMMLRFTYAHVDAQGNGIDDDPLMETEFFNYNISGNLNSYQKVQNQGKERMHAVFKHYDGLQRVTYEKKSVSDDESQITTYEYKDASAQIVTTLPNGTKIIKQMNDQGIPLSQEEQALVNQQLEKRVTQYDFANVYNSVMQITYPDSRQVMLFWDFQQRLLFTLSNTGFVTGYEYNRKKRYKKTTVYEKAVDKSQLKDPFMPFLLPTAQVLIEVMNNDNVPNPAKDRTSYEFYDQSERTRYLVDPEQYVSEIIYDTLNRPIAKIAYKNPLSDAMLQQLLNGLTIEIPFNPSEDRCTRTYYDRDGLVIAEQDTAGYITEYKRNSAGWVLEKIIYANKQAINLNQQDFNPIRPSPNPAKDAHIYFFYNHRGLCEIEVDAEGYLTETAYITGGLVDKTRRYINKVDTQWFNHPTVRPELPIKSDEDLVMQYDYDLLNREITTQQCGQDKIKKTVYDEMGHVIAQKTQDEKSLDVINGDTYRATEKRYDNWQQIINEANAFVAEKLAIIDADPNLNPDQKKQEKNQVWQKYSTRHLFDGSGLKLKTLVSIASQEQFDKGETRDALTYFYYDLERRPVISITLIDDKTTAIQENSLNTFDDVIVTRRYSQSLPADFISHLTGGFITDALRAALDAIKNDKDIIEQTEFTKRSLPFKSMDGEGYISTKNFDAFKQCIEEVLPVADKQPTLKIRHEFETRGLEITTSKYAAGFAAPITVHRRFDNLYGKQTALTDEIQATWQFEHDRLGRQVKTTDPLDEKSYVEFDALNRPTKEIDALTQITQHTYHQKDREHIIVPPVDHTQLTIQTNIFGDEVRTTNALGFSKRWRHGPTSKVTEYTDELNQIIVDKYNLAGWHDIHLNAQHIKTCMERNNLGFLIKKIVDSGGLNLTSVFKRDNFGNAIITIDPRSIVKQSTFDRRNQLKIEVIDPTDQTKTGLNLLKQHEYNGQGNLTSVMQGDLQDPNQSLQTFQFDGIARNVGNTVDPTTPTHEDALNIQFKKILNSVDKVVAEIDPNGNTTWQFYDKRQLKCFEVNADRGVMQWEYNAVGKPLYERIYATALTPEDYAKINQDTSLDILMLMLHISHEDTLTCYFYDTNNRERFILKLLWDSINQKQFAIVKEKNYNGANKIIKTTDYATLIEVANLDTFTTEKLEKTMQENRDPEHDRTVYIIADARGQDRFTIDPEGVISENYFDENGKVIIQVIYAKKLEQPEIYSNLTPEQFIHDVITHIKNDNEDRYTYYIYDDVKRPWFKINAEGAVTRFKHDEDNNLVEKYEFNQTVNVPQTYIQLVAAVKALNEDPQYDRKTQTSYDNNNKQITQTDALNYSDHYKRNALGQIVEHIDRSGASWRKEYDRAGRVVLETAPAIDVAIIQSQADGTLKLNGSNTINIKTRKIHDKNANLTKLIIAEGQTDARTIENHYNASGKLVSTDMPNIMIDNGSPIDHIGYRPETPKTLTTRTVYDTRKRKIAFCNEGGFWTYYLRNNLGKIVYKIAPGGAVTYKLRDTFNQVREKIEYAIAFPVSRINSVNQFNLSINELANFYNTHRSIDDRHTSYQYDKRGLLLQNKKGSVYDYEPDISKQKGIRKFEDIKKTSAVQTYQYNAFAECIYKAVYLTSNTKQESFVWFNRTGKKYIVAESLGDKNNQSRYKVDSYQYNAFSEKSKSHEYKNDLNQILTTLIPIETLRTWLNELVLPEDRQIHFDYYLTGKLKAKTRINVLRQKIDWQAEQPPKMVDIVYEGLSETYLYNALELPIGTIHENGKAEYIYYNAMQCVIAKTGVPRDNLGLTQTIIPLTYFGINAHGQTVLTQRFLKGTANADPAKLPQPIATDTGDQLELSLFDGRGKEIIRQNANGYPHAFSYTDSGQLAREWWRLTNWLQDEKNPTVFTRTQTHIDIKQFVYDVADLPSNLFILRDGKIVQSTYTVNNVFGEVIAEGDNPDNYAIYRKFDTLGRIWLSNMSGVDTVYFYNLANAEVLKIDSATKANVIRNLNYEQLPEILGWSITDAERMEKQRDLQNQVQLVTFPASYVDNPNVVQLVPLNLYVGKLYPEIGEINVSWPLVQEKTVQLVFWYWPSGTDEVSAKSLPIKLNKTGYRSGVDFTGLASDQYEYRIDYEFLSPNINPNEPPQKIKQFESRGQFQINTGINTGSQHCLPMALKDGTVQFVGKTEGLSQAAIFQNGIQIGNALPVINNVLDMSSFASGFYQFKPLLNGQLQALSLPVPVFTNVNGVANQTVMAYEINTDVTLRTLKNYGELNLKISEPYGATFMRLECTYLSDEEEPKEYTETYDINPQEPRVPHFDADQKELLSNFSFVHPVKSIKSFTLGLRITTTAGFELLPLYQSVKTPAAEQANTSEHIQTFPYGSKVVLYIKPWSNLSKAPKLRYLDTNKDRFAYWIEMQSMGYTSEGFVLDASGMQPGYYPFTLLDNENKTLQAFTILQGGQSFPGDFAAIDNKNKQQLAQPNRIYGYDRWNNKTAETDSFGNTTEMEYNDVNKMVQKLQPPVDVYDFNGAITPNVRPQTRYGYDVLSTQIGITDPNGHTQAFITDGSNVIQAVLADGSVKNTRIFDSLNRATRYKDSRGNTWEYAFDHENNTVGLTSPLNRVLGWQYDELNQLVATTNPAGQSWRYSHDINGNISESYLPLGNKTVRIYDRNRELLQITNPDGTTLHWARDYFGNAQNHTDLAGGVITYLHDGKQRVIEQYQTGGTPYPYPNVIVSTSSQEGSDGDETWKSEQKITLKLDSNWLPHLRYKYALGNCIEVEDLAHDMKFEYGVNLEGIRYKTRIWNKGLLKYSIESKLDALGREMFTQNNQSISLTGFDAAGNRRFLHITAYLMSGVAQHILDYKKFTHQANWEFDATDNVIKEDRIIDGKRSPLLELGYTNGLRTRERRYSPVTNWVEADLQYDADGRLYQTDYSSGERVLRTYTPSGNLSHYQDFVLVNGQWQTHLDRQLSYNANNWLYHEDRTMDGNPTVTTDYTLNLATGNVAHNYTNYHDENGSYDDITYDYAARDQWKLYRMRGTRHNQYGTSSSDSYLIEGPNGEPMAIAGAQDSHGNIVDSIFSSTYDGQVLSLQTGDGFPEWIYNHYSASGQLLSCYRTTLYWGILSRSEINILLGPTNYASGGLCAPAWSTSFGKPDVKFHYTVPRHELMKKARTVEISRWVYGETDDLGNADTMYVVQSGDTYDSIAKQQFGDPSVGEWIKLVNGSSPPVPGQTLMLPQQLVSKNNQNTAVPYQVFLALMQRNILPHLDTPTPEIEDDWWDSLVGFVTLGIAILLAIPTGGTTLGFMGLGSQLAGALGLAAGSLGSTLVTGIVAGLLDAALQEVMIGLGVQKHFSASQVVSATFSAAGAAWAQTGSALVENAVIDSMLKMGAINVAEQLSLMALGQQKQFDFTQTASVMIGSAVEPQLSKLPGIGKGFSQNLLQTVTGTVINGALKGRISLEQMSAQLLGNVILSEITPHLEEGLAWADQTYFHGRAAEQIEASWDGYYQQQSKDALVGQASQRQWLRPIPTEVNHLRPAVTRRIERSGYGDWVLESDFNKLLDPRLDPDDPRLMRIMANGSGAILERRYEALRELNPTAAKVRELNQLSQGLRNSAASFWEGTVANPQSLGMSLVVDFNQAVTTLINAPYQIASEVYHDFASGNIVAGIAQTGMTALSVIPAGRLGLALSETVVLGRQVANEITILGKTLIPQITTGSEMLGESFVKGMQRFGIFKTTTSTLELTPGYYELNPAYIRFTQSDVSPFFSHGMRIDELVNSLKSKTISPNDLPPIQVVSKNGILWSIDNRRLLAFNAANIEKIPVEVVSLDNPEIAERFYNRFDPIIGQGNYVAVATRDQRIATQQLLKEHNLIKGIQLDY